MAINKESYAKTAKAEYSKLAIPAIGTAIGVLFFVALAVKGKEIYEALSPYLSAMNVWLALLLITVVIYHISIITMTNKESEKTKSVDAVIFVGVIIILWFVMTMMVCGEKIYEQIIFGVTLSSAVTMIFDTINTPLAIAYARCKEEKNVINI
jgi:hypothetical protein